MLQIRRRPPTTSVDVLTLRYEVKIPDTQPQNILEEIIWHKETEVAQIRERLSLLDLRKQIATLPPPHNFFQALKNGKTQPAVIAEIKKASPSKGVIRADFDPVAIARSYQAGQASCLSVLTDEKFFQGSFNYLAEVRKAVDLPLLCKDFVIYPYQIYYARKHGADAILLIAAVLSDQDLKYFAKIAKSLNMTALVEVHSLEELERVLAIEEINLIGINNRDLTDFSVDLQTTVQLISAKKAELAARDILMVSESGIFTKDDIDLVKNAGAGAVLIGESFMKQPEPGEALQALF